MARVHRALYLANGERVVAVKMLGSTVVEQGVIEEAYRRELLALTELKHDGIVEPIDQGIDSDGGCPFKNASRQDYGTRAPARLGAVLAGCRRPEGGFVAEAA